MSQVRVEMKKSKKPYRVLDVFRQGDVLILKVSHFPAIEMASCLERGRAVLAHGEISGHAHVVVGRGNPEDHGVAEFFEAPGTEDRFLLLHADGVVTHQEHDIFDLDEGGHYIVRRQREYSPEAIQNVAD